MAFKIHVFDTTGCMPEDGTRINVHCGKSLTIDPLINLLKAGQKTRCTECFKKSRQFMESHSNVIVHTIFIGEEFQEEQEGPQEATAIISKKDWQTLLKNGSSVGMIQVFSEGELHEKFGDRPEQYIVRVKITPVVS